MTSALQSAPPKKGQPVAKLSLSPYSLLLRMFKAAALIDERWIKAKAFGLIQDRLFRLPWVKAIAVRGFRPSEFPQSPEARFLVLTDTVPTDEMQEQVESIVAIINRRFHVSMLPLVVDRIDAVARGGGNLI